ncbi:MAG: hypothetical protein IPL88_07260 [Rhizobiales bacterium]|nr:hypothetical protein [Hyphomicrobiales bacterium]
MTRAFAKTVLAGALVLIAADAAQAACARSGYRFGPGIHRAQSLWVVEAGKPCATVLNPARLFLSGLTIAERASHGVAGVGSRYQYAYNPQPGYVGRDRFVVRIEFEQNGRRGATLVAVDVVVRPAR